MPLSDLIGDLRDESGLWDALAVEDAEEADAVRTVFAWSYRALSEEAARLFRLLGLHPGPDFCAPAAAALFGADLRHTRRLLDVLAGAHLLEQTGRERYQFHDLLRSYAVEQVRDAESEEIRRECLQRLANWYLHAARAAVAAMDPHLPHPPPEVDDERVPHFADAREGLGWYVSERANLAAMIRAAADVGLPQVAWQLPVSLRHVLIFHSPVEEWTALTRLGLDSAQQTSEVSGQADLLESLGMTAVQRGHTEEALELHAQALDLRHGVGDAFGAAISVNSLGLALLRAGRLPEARSHFERCLREFRARGDQRWGGITTGNLAAVALDEGQPETALNLATQALELHRGTGNALSAFAALVTASECLRTLGRTAEALPYARQSLDTAQELESPVREAYALVELGRIQVETGAAEDALVSFHHAATLYRRIGDTSRETEALHEAGRAHAAAGRPHEAASFMRGAAVSRRQSK